MVTLEELNLNKKIITALNKKNIYTGTDLARTFPRKYLDYREIYSINESVGKDCAIAGYVQQISRKEVNKMWMISAQAVDLNTGQLFTVRWYGMSYLWESIQKLPFKNIVFCGKVSYDKTYGYSMSNPYSYHAYEQYNGRIIPVYPKYKGISEQNLKKLISDALKLEKEPLPEEVLQKTKLMRYEEALRMLHYPKSFEEIEAAQRRIIFNDMLYFSLQIKSNGNIQTKESPYIIKTLAKTKQFLDNRPFELTEDQSNCVNTIFDYMREGKRVNALVQGDVGCGKTMIAFSAMFAMAENGFQSCIMAPTAVLASQHYNELSEYAVEHGFKTAYLSSELKAKEKKELLKDIKMGIYDFVVGTHSVISDSVEYFNLGLVVTDEEHRFGVKQRDKLEEKAGNGAHVISMSATPIPRTIADILYGEDKELFTVKTLPKGRKPIQTAINCSDKVIFDFIEKQIKEGRQAYVICPLIEENEKREHVLSVEKTLKQYTDYFAPRNIRIAMVNGKMKKADSDAIVMDFKEHKYDILISTTVIEVGVNVPNANVIVINNAELFGLAQMHQLRGRVGRGSHSSYCILRSFEKENERLQIMCRTNDGFEIAKEDLALRGVGDLLGTEQSGNNHYAELIMAMPHLYEHVKKYADWIMRINKTEDILMLYEKAV